MKKIILSILVVGGLVGILSFAQSASAQTNDMHASLIEKIAKRFNLDQAEVKKVFDDDRTDHQKQMQQKYEDTLSQAVKDGKITEAQKRLILEKHNELSLKREQNRDQFMNLTPEQRKAVMESERAELEKWANENGINLSYFKMHKFGLGDHMGRMRSMMNK